MSMEVIVNGLIGQNAIKHVVKECKLKSEYATTHYLKEMVKIAKYLASLQNQDHAT